MSLNHGRIAPLICNPFKILHVGPLANSAVILFGILGSYLFLHFWENILLKLGK